MTDTLCVLPFIHFNLLANGQASLCCVSNAPLLTEDGRPLNVRTHSLGDIWGSSAIRDVRQLMLAGEMPTQCTGCYASEASGAGSHRLGQNSLFMAEQVATLNWVGVTKILRTELGVVMPKPWYFDLRFDNLCNLKCVICFGYASSRIEGDAVQMAWTAEQPIERTPNRFGNSRKWVRSDVLFEELKDIGSDVRFIQLAGGEPFMSSLAMRWLRSLADSGCAGEVVLKIFTNLTIFDEEIVALLAPFKFVDITLSIDATGSLYEYVRYPGKWDLIEHNTALLADQMRRQLLRSNVTINATMSALGATRILEVFDFAKRYGFGCSLGNTMSPVYAATRYLPSRSKQRLLGQLHQYAIDNPQFQHLPAQLAQWSNELGSVNISSPGYISGMREVMSFINDMDVSRGLSFQTIQPELYGDWADECGGWVQGVRFATPNSTVSKD